jgi:hypothetical protein
MADIKVRFAVNPDAETEKLGNLYVDNVGKVSNSSFKVNGEGRYQDQPQNSVNGINALSFAKGYLVFDNNGYLSNGDYQSGVLVSEKEPQEFVWGATDNEGYYDVTINFKNASNLDAVVFYGDFISRQFPTIAYLDNSNTPIYSDDARWVIKFNTPSSSHSIRFVKWNRKEYNAVLTKIAVVPKWLEINKKSGLKSVTSLSQTNSDANNVYYGIIPSSGEIKLIDVYGDFADLIRDGIIDNSGLQAEIKIGENNISSIVTQDSDYDTSNREVSFNTQDWITDLDNLQFLGYKYNGSKKKLYEILESVMQNVMDLDDIEYMCSEEIICGNKNELMTVKRYLESIEVMYPYLSTSTYREVIDKICMVAQLNACLDDSGRIKLYNARPIESVGKLNNCIIIPSNRQLSPIQNAVVVKNKFTGVDLKEKSVLVDNRNIGEKAITFYVQNDNGSFEDVIGEIDSEYRYAEVVESTSLGTQRWYSNITYNIPFNAIYLKNAKIKYKCDWHNTASNNINSYEWDVDLPSEGETIGSFNTGEGSYDINRPKIVVEKLDKAGFIKLKMTTWVGGDILLNGHYYRLLNSSLSISGDILNANETNLSFGSSKNKLNFESNELVQDTSKFASNKISQVIANNILNDYANGITFGEIEVICGDYYFSDGTMAIDWSKNEVLQIGDIVRIDKNNYGTSGINYANNEPVIAKIISREFVYSGVPKLLLGWREVKLV